MKKTTLLLFIFSILLVTSGYSQVSSMTNNSPMFPPNPFLGWNGVGPGGQRPLEIPLRSSCTAADYLLT